MANSGGASKPSAHENLSDATLPPFGGKCAIPTDDWSDPLERDS